MSLDLYTLRCSYCFYPWRSRDKTCLHCEKYIIENHLAGLKDTITTITFSEIPMYMRKYGYPDMNDWLDMVSVLCQAKSLKETLNPIGLRRYRILKLIKENEKTHA